MKPLKVLYLVRHAKSDWDNEGTADIDRPLKAKGIRKAYEVARRLKLDNMIPDLIISSPANRAMHTAIIFTRVFGLPTDCFQVSNILYESSSDKIIELIKSTGSNFKSLMLVGHNPDFSELASSFVKSHVVEIPASGVVTLKFNIDNWQEIHTEKLFEHALIFPGKFE
jgi:phosphohistidine phosphatase